MKDVRPPLQLIEPSERGVELSQFFFATGGEKVENESSHS